MKVLVFGYGLHGGGFDSAMYFLSHGDEVRITDVRDREILGESVDFLEKKGAVIHCPVKDDSDFLWADVVIKNPTVRNDNEYLKSAKRVENDISYGSSRPESLQTKIICVTGARDKTITASAICHSLNSMGHKAHVIGNTLATAFSEIRRWDAGDVPEYLIIEMSTWQARDTYIYIKKAVPQVAVSVITSPFGQADVFSGEFNAHSDHIVCPSEVKRQIAKISAGKAGDVSEIESTARNLDKSLPDKMAPAFAVLRKLGFSATRINDVLKCFKGIPNRNEMVLRTAQTMYINDSSSMIPEAVNFTMANFENLPVHLICGGSDAGLDATVMLNSLRTAASVHLLDGSFTRKQLIPVLRENGIGYEGPFEKIEEAFDSASSKLDPQSKIMQVVLLSPGAAAFEFFPNEFIRGNAFRDIVNRQVRPDTSSN